MELNLTANGKAQELILAYLKENASETLAEKINKGVVIEKDGKRLLNKKTLDGFMKFATDEARKLAEKGAISACVEDAVVYGWAMHYFEESSIEGTLYNEDGSEYKPAPKAMPKSTARPTPVPAPKKQDDPQMSLFSLLETETKPPVSEIDASGDDEEPDEDDEPDEDCESASDEIEEIRQEIAEEINKELSAPTKGNSMYQHYVSIQEKYPDAIILYRLGDFYEAFGACATKIADALDLTLTGRDVGLAERVAMTGLPHHAVDSYVAKLVEKGIKVIVVEPIGERTTERVIESRKPLGMTVDAETGEVLSETPQEDSDDLDEFDTSAFNSEAVAILYELFGNEIEVR